MWKSSERKNTVGSFSTKEHHNRGLSFPGSISTCIDWSTQDNNVNPVDLEAWSCAGLSPIATANTANGSDDVIMKILPVRLSHYFTESQHVSGDLSPCSEWCSLMLGIRLDHYTERNSSSALSENGVAVAIAQLSWLHGARRQLNQCLITALCLKGITSSDGWK